MSARTDLASESQYITGGETPKGVDVKEERSDAARLSITRIEIKTDEASRRIGRPKGRYMTLRASDSSFEAEADCFNERAALLAREIAALLPADMSRGALFAGLGNRQITPDSVGPLAADRILATRHIESHILKELGELAKMSVISPGVLAQTGLESAEIIKMIAQSIDPSVIIVCDAFACSDPENLGTTVQLCDTGISPGSGVGNSRAEISLRTMGVPCIAAGIPTVADIDAVAEKHDAALDGMVITPGRIDTIVKHGSMLISLAVNMAVHSSLTAEEINALVG
ncbi:GPR endopeptidase [Ruminococcus sp. NK3A76]|uniref:GPR endopeptidase n=1 Tax=Ruminococcus sp. NK3A76 TaxID=877411 RepID=UPI00048D525E|nr:GPR endopeptidase [Ruminococcus sp. NK3A76]